MADIPIDVERLRAQVEIEITRQALELFKSLRQEYADMNERLKRRVDDLEKQRDESISRLDNVATSLKDAQRALKVAQKKERDYQETIARLTREVENLRIDLVSLRNENIALSRLVEELRNEVDGFRADMRGD